MTAHDPVSIGPYRLQGRIGAGGMGTVYLGFSPQRTPAAIKYPHPDLAADPEFRERFRQEVTAARRVSGAFVAEVLDADVDVPRPWMATRYVEGVSLGEAVATRGGLGERLLGGLAVGLADALVAIHSAGVVHRDLKPANVLLAWDAPKVIDFGIARTAEATHQTRVGDLIGTLAWMAPEQLLGEKAGPPADVFAWGACVAYAATGRHPFAGGDPTGNKAVAAAGRVLYAEPDLTGVPERLAGVVARALVRDPAGRPSAEELVEALVGRPVDGAVDAERTATALLASGWNLEVNGRPLGVGHPAQANQPAGTGPLPQAAFGVPVNATPSTPSTPYAPYAPYAGPNAPVPPAAPVPPPAPVTPAEPAVPSHAAPFEQMPGRHDARTLGPGWDAPAPPAHRAGIPGDMSGAATSRPAHQRVPSAPSVPTQPERRDGAPWRYFVAASAVGVFLLAGVLVWFVQQSSGDNGPEPQSQGTQASATAGTEVAAPQVPAGGPAAGGTSTSPGVPPAESEYDQAVRMNGLLERTSADRLAVIDAVNDVMNCGNVTADARAIDAAGDSRDDIADELRTADFSKLPNSGALLSSLEKAMRTSATADREYAEWARNVAAGGCSGSASTNDDHFRAGDAWSRQATAAKNDFVAPWNPVATSHGLRTWEATEL